MRFIVFMELGPNWESSGTDGTQASIARAHYDYQKGLYENGTVILGGPFKKSSDGLYVLEAPSREEAEKAFSADPGVEAGLFKFTMRDHFTIFDAHAGSVRPFPGG